jgi:hypothetical protein
MRRGCSIISPAVRALPQKSRQEWALSLSGPMRSTRLSSPTLTSIPQAEMQIRQNV